MRNFFPLGISVIVATFFSLFTYASQINHYQIIAEVTGDSGHKINGYKYICIENQGNQYDLEDKFNAFFSSIGFVTLTQDEEALLDKAEKKYVLYGTYVCQLVVDGASNLTLTLRNKDGKIVFSSSKEGLCFASPKCDFKRASDKIIQQITSLNYSFDPALEQNERSYSSDEALQELERWKRKLDLQIITQEEYDNKKEELKKFID